MRSPTGGKLRWEATSKLHERARGKPLPSRSGTVVVDKDGVFVIKAVKIGRRSDLTVKVTPGK